jgi:opacity protein-like surface antigen
VSGDKRQSTILRLAGSWIVGVVLAACLTASAAADSVETATSVAVRPGPLALRGVPNARSFTPEMVCTTGGVAASLPPITVVDATGSGRGWHLAIVLLGAGSAWARADVSAYNGPPQLAARSAGEVQLGVRPQTIAYALPRHGMGTSVLGRLVLRSRVPVRVRFLLAPGP